MTQQSTLFLILNASIVWAVLAGGMMWLLRSKLLVLALLLTPYVIGSTFQHIAGMPQLIGMDLSRNCAAPLTAYYALKENTHGNETNRRI